jgi:hypothetical protein
MSDGLLWAKMALVINTYKAVASIIKPKSGKIFIVGKIFELQCAIKSTNDSLCSA